MGEGQTGGVKGHPTEAVDQPGQLYPAGNPVIEQDQHVQRSGVDLHQLARACAVLGVKLVHAAPRAATTKGKIERFWRTVRDRFLVEVDDGVELVELNRLFSAWLEVVYHRCVHSETGVSPIERFSNTTSTP